MQLVSRDGHKITVDKDDHDKFKNKKLYIIKGYPAYCERRKLIKLHRAILDAQEGQEVDHINRDKLDNRKTNLRFCSRSENLQNRAGYGSVKIKGVHWDRSRKKFVASITVNGRSKWLGYFDDPISAKQAWLNYRGTNA